MSNDTQSQNHLGLSDVSAFPTLDATPMAVIVPNLVPFS